MSQGINNDMAVSKTRRVVKNLRWWMLVLFLLGVTVNYITRNSLGILAPELKTSLGITTEQYFDMVAEQLPRRMLRQRLRDTLGQEYCAQHGLEFTKVNPPEQMTKYVEQYLDNLLEAHRSEIKYY